MSDSSEEGDAGVGGETVLSLDFVHLCSRGRVGSGVVAVVDEGVLSRRDNGHAICCRESVARKDEIEKEKGKGRRLT